MPFSKLKPRILLSRCLKLDPCRYDGTLLDDSMVSTFVNFFHIEGVCPEEEIGMPTPRPPIFIVKEKEKLELIRGSDQKNFTRKMSRFAKSRLARAKVHGYLLKARSPSCGIIDTPIYQRAETGAVTSKLTSGLFAAQIQDQAILDEKRFAIPSYRFPFLCEVNYRARLEWARDHKQMDFLKGFYPRTYDSLFSVTDFLRKVGLKLEIDLDQPLGLEFEKEVFSHLDRQKCSGFQSSPYFYPGT